MAYTPKPKQNPPHVKLFTATCPQCDRHYEGNFPMWVEIDAFPCICGATVPPPVVHMDGGFRRRDYFER